MKPNATLQAPPIAGATQAWKLFPRRVTVPGIADGDPALAHRAPAPPAFAVFEAVPGAGAVCAPRLRVAVGAPRARDASAEALQKYAGLAPVPARRGKTSWGYGRLQGPKVLRHTGGEWAADSTRQAFWAPVSSQHHRDRGTAPQAAVRALACTGLRLLSRCWPARTPSDASLALQARNRRSAPRRQHLATSACSGVQKP
jgi:Transposase IS116/IS110/IS902 family